MRTLWAICAAVSLVVATPPQPAAAQIDELPRPAQADTSTFGVSVALDDSIAVVGASGEQRCGPNAGAVYVFERPPKGGVDAWRATARLVPSDCRANMFFGGTVALSGTRVLVGASSEYFAEEESNAAYVFRRDSAGKWQQTARFTGDPGRREGLFAAGLDLEGTRAAVSTSGSTEGEYGGAVYVFDYDAATDTWRRTARLTARQGAEKAVLGYDVALDGNCLAVAASTFFRGTPGAVYIFRRRSGTGQWQKTTRLSGIDAFFIDIALHDGTLVVGEPRAGPDGAGAATVYEASGGSWSQAATLRPAIPYDSGAFGEAVSVEGDRLLASGYDEQLGKEYNIDRVVYAFQRRGEMWRERPIIDVGEVAFGAALAQSGDVTLISSVPETQAGKVYVVRLP